MPGCPVSLPIPVASDVAREVPSQETQILPDQVISDTTDTWNEFGEVVKKPELGSVRKGIQSSLQGTEVICARHFLRGSTTL